MSPENTLFGLVLLLALMPTAGCRTTSGSATSDGIVDPSGRGVDPLRTEDARPVVLIFTRSDCPISNRYAPEVHRLHERFAPQVVFWLVYPDPEESPEVVRAHLQEYDYRCGALRDTRQTLVSLTGATVTPEAAVFLADGEMVYRGRIDDRFVDFGQARAAATTHDLEEVLDAIVGGRPVRPRTTRAIGCFIPDLP